MPVNPVNGQQYANDLGTRYQYDATRQAWVIVSQALGVTGLQGAQGVTGTSGGPTGIQGPTDHKL